MGAVSASIQLAQFSHAKPHFAAPVNASHALAPSQNYNTFLPPQTHRPLNPLTPLLPQTQTPAVYIITYVHAQQYTNVFGLQRQQDAYHAQ